MLEGDYILCTVPWSDHVAEFQNVCCFKFEQSIVYHKVAVKNIYNVLYFKTQSMCISNAVKKEPGIGFIVDVLFDYFAYRHNLYTVVELHTNFVLIHFESQPISTDIQLQGPLLIGVNRNLLEVIKSVLILKYSIQEYFHLSSAY